MSATGRSHHRQTSRPRESIWSQSPELPTSWQPSRTHYDTKTEYGLNFPRHVESTNFSRKNGTAGMAVTEVKVTDILSNGIENWALRLVANGRYVAREMFRNRLEATFSTMLFREMYRQKDQVDFVKLIHHLADKPSDSQDWKAKMVGIEALIKHTVELFKKLSPEDTNQSLLEELEKIRKEMQNFVLFRQVLRLQPQLENQQQLMLCSKPHHREMRVESKKEHQLIQCRRLRLKLLPCLNIAVANIIPF